MNENDTLLEQFDEDEVLNCLERETSDGRGEGEIPESDWKGFATENVEVEV